MKHDVDSKVIYSVDANEVKAFQIILMVARVYCINEMIDRSDV